MQETRQPRNMPQITIPIANTSHPCVPIWLIPIGFSLFPITDFNKSYSVAAIIVGMEREKENSKAALLDMPANCPAAIVVIERDVPGNMADSGTR
jgi:hypothetical protein